MLKDYYNLTESRLCVLNFICGNGGMADAPDLGSGAARCGGSSPLSRTNNIELLAS